VILQFVWKEFYDTPSHLGNELDVTHFFWVKAMNQIGVSIDKRLIRTNLDFLILRRLRQGSCHGYGLIRFFKEKYGFYFGTSTIYPVLCALEKRGLIESSYETNGKHPRKICRITLKGSALLKECEKKLEILGKFDSGVAVLTEAVQS